jgi:hypothetical protein
MNNLNVTNEIDRLRTELRATGKLSVSAENIVATARNNAATALKLRELRGHADLFKIETNPKTN